MRKQLYRVLPALAAAALLAAGSEDLIGEIANMYPETQDFLSSLGMHCFGCAAAGAETLAEACRVHGLNTFKVKRELNRIITENPA